MFLGGMAEPEKRGKCMIQVSEGPCVPTWKGSLRQEDPSPITA